MARQAQRVGTISQLTTEQSDRLASRAIQLLDKNLKSALPDELFGNAPVEDKMADTEKDLNELNMKLAEENKNLRETAELLFKENQTLRNELNVLNVIILRKTAQEVGVQYGQPQTAQSTESTAT